LAQSWRDAAMSLTPDMTTRLGTLVRAHMAEAKRQIVSMPRAGPGVADEDARQLVHNLHLALLEDLEGKGTEQRERFVEDATQACAAAGVSCDTLVKGIIRSCTVLLADVLPELPAEARTPVGRWMGEFLGAFVCEVIESYGRAQ
jgi:hypothetical protein